MVTTYATIAVRPASPLDELERENSLETHQQGRVAAEAAGMGHNRKREPIRKPNSSSLSNGIGSQSASLRIN